MVAKITFDNSQFESSCKQSMSTLDTFQKKLSFDGAKSGVKSLQKDLDSVNTEAMVTQLDAVQTKMSTLSVIKNAFFTELTQQITDAALQFSKSVTIDNVTDGFSKYESKTSSVQTIMNATGKSIEEVNGYLDKLMWYSDETSYGFDDMVSSISQLTSAGGDIEKLIPMVEGIANATAFSGKSAAEFSRAIYNLNQSYSAGSLKYMDWKSLDMAGVSSKQLKQALIDAGQACGMLDENFQTAAGTLVDISSFSETLSENWATRDVMETGFGYFAELTEACYQAVQDGTYDTCADAIAELGDQYSEIARKGFSAAQQAKSFTEAVDATKDAVSSSFMRIFESLFGNYEQATVLWTEVCDALYDNFTQPIVDCEELLDETLSSSFTDLRSIINKCGYSVSDFEDALREQIGEEGSEVLDELIEEWGTLGEVIDSGNIDEQTLRDTFDALVEQAGVIENVTLEMIENADAADQEVLALNYISQQAKITGSEFDEMFKSMAVPTGRTLALTSIRNILVAIIKPINAIKTGFSEAFAALNGSEALYNALEKIEAFTEKLVISDSTAQALKNTFSAVGNVVQIVGKVFSSVAKIITGSVSKAFSVLNIDLGDTLENVTNVAKRFTEWANENIDLSGIVESVTDWVGQAVEKVKDWISSLEISTESLQTFIEPVKEKFAEWFDKIVDFLGDGGDKFKEWFEDISDWAKKLDFSNIKEQIGGLIDKIRNGDDIATAAGNSINKMLTNTSAGIKDSIAVNLTDSLDLSGSAFEEWGQKIITVFKTVGENISSKFGLGEIISMVMTGALVSGLSNVANATDRFINIFSSGITTILHPVEALTEGLGKITVATGDGIRSVFNALTVGIKKFTAQFAANSLKTIAEAIALLTASIAGLALLWPQYGDDIKQVCVLLGAVAGALGVLTVALSKLVTNTKIIGGKEEGGGAFLILISMAAAMLSFAIAMKQVSKVWSDDIATAWLSLGTIIVIIATVVIALNKLGPSCITLIKMAPNILAMGGLVVEIALAIRALNDVHLEAGPIVGLIGALVTVIGSLVILTKVFKVSGASSVSIGAGFAAIAAAIYMLIRTINLIQTIDWNYAWDDIGTVAATVAALVGLAFLLKKGAKEMMYAGVGVLAISAGIDLLIVAFRALANMEPDVIAKGIIAIDALMVGVGVMIKLAGAAGEFTGKALASFALVSLGLTLLSGAILILGAMKEEKVWAGALALDSMMIAAGLMAKLATAGNDVKVSKFAGMAAAVGILALIAGMFTAFVDEEGSLLIAVGCLDTLMLCLGGMVALSKIGGDFKVGPILAMSAFVAALGGVLVGIVALTDDCKQAVYAAEAVSLMAVAMSAAYLAISNWGIFGTSSRTLLSLLGVSAIFAALGAILGILEKLDIAPSIESAEAISMMAVSFSGAFLLISNLAPGVAKASKAALSMASFFGITGGLGMALAAITELIGANGRFDYIMDGFDKLEEVFEAVGECIGSLVGGVLAGATNGLEKAADNVVLFCNTIAPAIASLNGTSTGDTSSAIVTLKDILGAMDGLGNFAKVDSELIEANLKAVSNGLRTYCQNIGDLDYTNVPASIDALDDLNSFMQTIGKTGGLTQLVFGKADGLKFGQYLAGMAEGLVEYNTAVMGITDYSAVQPSVNALCTIMDAFSNMPDSGGIIRWFSGDVDYLEFSRGMSYMSNGLAAYVSNLQGLDFTYAVAGTKTLKTVIEAFADIGSVKEGIGTWEQLGSHLGKVAKSLNQFVKGLEFEASDVSNVLMLCEGLSAAFNDTATYYIGDAAVKLNNLSQSLNDLHEQIELTSESFQDEGKFICEGIAEGMIKNMNLAINASADVAAGVRDKLREVLGIHSPSREGKAIGAYVDQGIAIGLTENSDVVTSASEDMGDDVVQTLSTSGSTILTSVKSAWSKISDSWTSSQSSLTSSTVDSVSSGLTTVGQALSNGLQKVSSEVETTLTDDSTSIISTLSGLISSKVSDTTSSDSVASTTAASVSSAISYVKTVTNDEISDWISELQDQFTDINKTISSSLSLSEARYNLWSAENPNATQAQQNEKQKELAEKQVEAAQKELDILQKEYDQAVAKYGSSAYPVMDLETELINKKIELIEAQNELASYSTVSYSDYYAELKEWADNDWYGISSSAASDLLAASYGIINKSIDEIDMSVQSATASASAALIAGTSATTDALTETYQKSGLSAATAYAEGLEEGVTYNYNELATLGITTVDATADSLSEMPQQGVYAADGLAEGATSAEATTEVYNAGFGLGLHLMSGYNAATNTHSPSREFIQRGMYAVQGLVLGIKNNLKMADNAGAEMGDSLVSSADYALEQIGAILAADEDVLSPVIRPVIDTSAIDSSSLGLNTRINVGEINSRSSSLKNAMEEYASTIQASNNEVISAINTIGSSMNSHYSKETDVQLYVDSKQLASSLAKPMSRQLNMLSSRKGQL